MKESFIFYVSFYKALQELSDSDRLTVYDAITHYSLTGEAAELSGVPKIVMTLIKPQLDANQKRYENGCKGGRPKNQTETKTEPKQNQNKTKSKPNKNDNVNQNVNQNLNISENLDEDVNQNVTIGENADEDVNENVNQNVTISGNSDNDVNENEGVARSLEISISEVAATTTPITLPSEIAQKIITPTAEIPIQWLYAWLRNKGEPYAAQVIKALYDHPLRPPDVWLWLDRYVNHIHGCGEARKTSRDFQQHFINWLRIRLRETHTTEAVTVTDGKLPSGERDCPIPR